MKNNIVLPNKVHQLSFLYPAMDASLTCEFHRFVAEMQLMVHQTRRREPSALP